MFRTLCYWALYTIVVVVTVLVVVEYADGVLADALAGRVDLTDAFTQFAFAFSVLFAAIGGIVFAVGAAFATIVRSWRR